MSAWNNLGFDQHYDVVIVGGGINGVAVARECALAKRSVLLLEQHDFASGTTSRSTRIIHGGLRYLEYGELGLVRQSLRERQRLLAQRSDLVRPLTFLLALPERDGENRHSALEIRTALWLYRKLGGEDRALDDKAELGRLEAMLDRGRRWSLFNFEDAQCEFPERLVAHWLSEAVAAGACVRNHTEVLDVVLRDGAVCGVRFRDRRTGDEGHVETENVINAAGPWVDLVCARSGINTGARLIGGVRGSHIVAQRFAGAPDAAVYTEGVDGRPIFVVPWNKQLLVGSTEVADEGDPGWVQPARDEAGYLFDSLRSLFPYAPIAWQDVRCVFAGVRPLPYAPGRETAAITRRHILHDHADDGARGMISVIGGKLTTAAAVGRDCARKLGLTVAEPSPIHVACAPDNGITAALASWAGLVAGMAGISEVSARAMAEWFGPRALAVAHRARSSPLMRETLCAHTAHLVAEAAEAVCGECAVTLGDILLRRVPVALGACWSAECSTLAAARIGSVMGWDERRITQELEQFEAERRQFLQEPGTQPPQYHTGLHSHEHVA